MRYQLIKSATFFQHLLSCLLPQIPLDIARILE